jgi:hypothetical protein
MVGVERTLTGLETVALPFWVWKISMGLMVGPNLELKFPSCQAFNDFKLPEQAKSGRAAF